MRGLESTVPSWIVTLLSNLESLVRFLFPQNSINAIYANVTQGLGKNAFAFIKYDDHLSATRAIDQEVLFIPHFSVYDIC